MRFYTALECEEWLGDRNRCKPDGMPDSHVERIEYPQKPHGVFVIADWIARSLTFQQPTLLWLTEWSVWPSSENWHLYHKLRQSYADHKLLHEAPGHLFLGHETADLASFLQIAMLNGWGGYVLTHANYVNAFFSHDEFIRFFAEHDENLSDARAFFRKRFC